MNKIKSTIIIKLFIPLLLLFVLPGVVFAHGDEEEVSRLAGPLAWAFLGFGIFVIVIVSSILFTSTKPGENRTSARDFESLAGFSGYIAKIRLFSRNARLFMVHVVGMDVIHGTWMVIFNLYLLQLGFDIAFIGLRILLVSITRAIFAIPAGIISDRMGRKLSFIIGDGGGAVMSLVAISTANPALLLLTGAMGGMFSAVHGVAEPAFMAENSADFERVHLFSVSDGTRTAAAIIGSVLAGLVPLLLVGSDEAALIGVYRMVAYAGIGIWFASLIPALMLKQVGEAAAPKVAQFRDLIAGIKHPQRIFQLTIPEVILAFGAGFALPLLNVFFHQNLQSPEIEIGVTFAAGQAFLVIAAFLAPLLAARLGKVRSVVYTRLTAIPFLLMLAFSSNIGSAIGTAFTIAGLAHIARITFMNMASPVRSAFAMEILDPAERGTYVGIQMALTSAVSGAAAYFGARMMSLGNFQTPFILMAGFLLISTVLFWLFFAQREETLVGMPAMVETVAAEI